MKIYANTNTENGKQALRTVQCSKNNLLFTADLIISEREQELLKQTLGRCRRGQEQKILRPVKEIYNRQIILSEVLRF